MARTFLSRGCRLTVIVVIAAVTLAASSEACGKSNIRGARPYATASSSASSSASASSGLARRARGNVLLARRGASAPASSPPGQPPAMASSSTLPGDGSGLPPSLGTAGVGPMNAPMGPIGGSAAASPATPMPPPSAASYPSVPMPSGQNASAYLDDPSQFNLPAAGPGLAPGATPGAGMPPGMGAPPSADQVTGAIPPSSGGVSSTAPPLAATPQPPAASNLAQSPPVAAAPAASGPAPASAPAPAPSPVSPAPPADEDPGEDIEAATFPEDGTDPVRKPSGPTYNNSLHMPVDQASCQGTEALQLDRALTELAGLAELGLKSLLDTPLAPINQRYWGAADESDLSIPIGVLTRLSGGNKTNIVIRCDGNKTLCNTDRVARSEGGYVSASPAAGSATAFPALMKLNVTNNVILCPSSFAGGKSERRWIEEICLDEWTLSANNPTVYWPASILALLLQAPVMSSPLMQTPVHAYANVLELARRDPLSSTHSVYTYLYFLLDVFAQKHIRGGCVGQVSGRVRE